MTVDAESTWNNLARSKNPTSSGFYSEGLFQQTLPWWKNDHWSPEESTNAFLDHFTKIRGIHVEDCWNVQRWQTFNAPVGSKEFYAAPSTINYTNRYDRVDFILRMGTLP